MRAIAAIIVGIVVILLAASLAKPSVQADYFQRIGGRS